MLSSQHISGQTKLKALHVPKTQNWKSRSMVHHLYQYKVIQNKKLHAVSYMNSKRTTNFLYRLLQHIISVVPDNRLGHQNKNYHRSICLSASQHLFLHIIHWCYFPYVATIYEAKPNFQALHGFWKVEYINEWCIHSLLQQKLQAINDTKGKLKPEFTIKILKSDWKIFRYRWRSS